MMAEAILEGANGNMYAELSHELKAIGKHLAELRVSL